MLRIDQESDGIAGEGQKPLARGLRVGVVARALVRARGRPGGPRHGRFPGVHRYRRRDRLGMPATLDFERGVHAAAREAGKKLG